MAESAERPAPQAWRTTARCRFYALGMCREGDRCKYLHEENVAEALADDQNVDVIKGKLATSTRKDSATEVERSSPGTDSSTISIVSTSETNDDQTTERDVDDTGTANISTSRGAPANLESAICQYFQQGCCMFGDNCFNKHELIASTEDSKSTPSDSLHIKSNSILTTAPSTSETDASSSLSLPSSSSIRKTKVEKLKQLETMESKTRLRVNAPEFVPAKFACPHPREPAPDDAKDTKEGRRRSLNKTIWFVNGPLLSSHKENSVLLSASAGKTWAQIVNSSAGNGVPSPHTSLCPYAEAGDCPYAETCTYIHGDTCEFCGNSCLHPTNEEQRKSHTDECIKQHEREMELAFAVASSKDKQCGVCFEVVVDKNPASEQRFGILPNCNHCFCLACIRKWRQAKQFENKIIRACPECRVTSDFVCPSMYWVDTKEDKDKLILAYKNALSNKQCKYFKQGRGKCPFGNKCFYLHAYPDGTKVDTGPPIRRHRQNADGDTDVLQLFLWDFLDERDNRWLYSLDDLDLMAFLSGSDDSDTSDIEFL